MDQQTTGEYDEALTRLHRYGPEFDGFLSNHGPMVVEAMWRQESSGGIHAWTDTYLERLEPAPGRGRPVDDWRPALGDVQRTADWLATFDAALAERSWRDVLATWWPRLLPGIAAGATHGVIRVGHAVQGLLAAETEPRTTELAHALGYWATRWRPVPVVRPQGTLDARQALIAVPVVADQSADIEHRVAQLSETAGYTAAVAALAGPDLTSADEARAGLERIIDAAVEGYARWAPGNPTMLVHAATAPNAVRMALPALPAALVEESVIAAWSASAAVMAAYRPRRLLPPGPHLPAEETVAAAVAHGSEHVIKLTDTALESWRRTGADAALEAAATARRLDA